MWKPKERGSRSALPSKLSLWEFGKVEQFCSVAQINLKGVAARHELELFLARTLLQKLRPEQIQAFQKKCFAKTVYFIQASAGNIKIGVSIDPRRRIEDLQTGTTEKLKIIGLRPEHPREKDMHILFAEERVSDGEWFTPSPRLLFFIEQFCYSECFYCPHCVQKKRGA